jgi:hypothetical protein
MPKDTRLEIHFADGTYDLRQAAAFRLSVDADEDYLDIEFFTREQAAGVWSGTTLSYEMRTIRSVTIGHATEYGGD